MNQTEGCWNDITIYYVEFIAQYKENGIQKYQKVVAFRRPVDEAEVAEFIQEYLTNIIEITTVNELLKASLLEIES